MQNTSNIILGIDPGTVVMGYGLIEVTGNSIRLIEMNVLKLSPKLDAYEKLEKIHTKVSELITEYKPGSFAIEAPFFGKNIQSMLKLGRAQGVAIAAAIQSGIGVTEYSPRKIKQSVTGNGNADKDQVMKMLQNLLSFTYEPVMTDATDALAVAVCHHFQHNSILKTASSKSKGWKEFMSHNPERIK